MKRKRIAWLVNLANIGIMSFLVRENFSPMYGAIACMVAGLTVLIAVIPEALTLKEVYNDEI